MKNKQEQLDKDGQQKREKEAKIKFSAPRGMKDILPEEREYWALLEEIIKKKAASFGFNRIETPILEYEKLFEKGTGDSTDIVRKEMFSLTTKGGDRLALRPEGTPSHARAYIENGMINWQQPVKIYSMGAMFRYERPQAGRKRQLHQADFDVIGDGDPIIDAQLINLAWAILSKIGIKNITAQINSVGCESCRKDYKNILAGYFKNRKAALCSDCAERLSLNPLRILDCKNKECQEIIENAPQVVDYLCKPCHDHFMLVLEYLDELEIPYLLNPRLVRGLDYYTKTVFEITSEEEEFKESRLAFAGGGRYDRLIGDLGGKDSPAAGFALGMDRIVMLMERQNLLREKNPDPKVFLIALGTIGKKKSLRIFNDLINSGISAREAFSKESLKAQLKIADKENAVLSLIIGQKEAIDETVIVRDMASGAQEIVGRNKVAAEVKRMLKNI